MWYALSHKQDYFAERTHRFIAMASCIAPDLSAVAGGLTEYEEIVAFFLKLREMGIENMYGLDEASATDYEVMCAMFQNYGCLVPDQEM